MEHDQQSLSQASLFGRDLSGKAANKLELQKEFGLPANANVPLFGNIGRLAEQKGVEIMLGALEEMLSANLQFVCSAAARRHSSEPTRTWRAGIHRKLPCASAFDEGLSHRIEAGCDFFLMPSRFEPCGLNQMYGLRYGTIPIVRATGGLDDTVIDLREDAKKANGIKFSEYSAPALAKAIRKALALLRRPGAAASFPDQRYGCRFLLGSHSPGIHGGLPNRFDPHRGGYQDPLTATAWVRQIAPILRARKPSRNRRKTFAGR